MLQYLHMKNNPMLTLTLHEQAIARLKKTYENNIVPSANPYMDALIKIDGCTISIYTSKKVVFAGALAKEMATLFGYQETPFFDHIGSDEVGTGDYFGPIVVCSAYIDHKTRELVKHLPIRDSKSMSDAQVVQLAKELTPIVAFSLLVLDNRKYNQLHETQNMNQIKAKLHNQALLHLVKKIKLTPKIIVDQFTPEKNYYQYLHDQENIVRNIQFETKAESKYIGVAIAAILARASFLKALDQLESQLKLPLLKGASDEVDNCGVQVVKQYGWPTLDKVAKMHFKNTQKIQEKLKK